MMTDEERARWWMCLEAGRFSEAADLMGHAYVKDASADEADLDLWEDGGSAIPLNCYDTTTYEEPPQSLSEAAVYLLRATHHADNIPAEFDQAAHVILHGSAQVALEQAFACLRGIEAGMLRKSRDELERFYDTRGLEHFERQACVIEARLRLVAWFAGQNLAEERRKQEQRSFKPRGGMFRLIKMFDKKPSR